MSLSAATLTLDAPRRLRWDTVQLPRPAAGQVRVQTLLSAVSVSSELSVIEGRTHLPLPRQLGYQTLGTVTEAGTGVKILPGTRVVTTSGHVSAAVVNEAACLPVPDHVPDRMALAAILGEETHKGLRKVAPLPRERVLVAGAGLIGLLTIFNLVRHGVTQVSVMEPDPARQHLAQAFGARVLHPADLQAQAFEVGFECSASPEGFRELLSRMRPGGRVCVLSDGNWGRLVLPPDFHSRELSVVASSDGEDYHRYAGWLWKQSGTLLEQLYASTVRPADLIAAFDSLQSVPRPVSLVVDWRHSGSSVLHSAHAAGV
ncbi:zinc-dependent alcohol dehydrogenase [Deinococcus sp.]|uniref:zinc-dependent alcohol dehydrogenase n=1 Tax=Deinococcus sp. TaxID=47478 RepID=UPI003CC508E7